MNFDFEHLKKLCVCKRTTKGFDYGETHPKLGKCEVGQRWSSTQENFVLLENQYKSQQSRIELLEKEISELKKQNENHEIASLRNDLKWALGEMFSIEHQRDYMKAKEIRTKYNLDKVEG